MTTTHNPRASSASSLVGAATGGASASPLYSPGDKPMDTYDSVDIVFLDRARAQEEIAERKPLPKRVNEMWPDAFDKDLGSGPWGVPEKQMTSVGWVLLVLIGFSMIGAGIAIAFLGAI